MPNLSWLISLPVFVFVKSHTFPCFYFLDGSELQFNIVFQSKLGYMQLLYESDSNKFDTQMLSDELSIKLRTILLIISYAVHVMLIWRICYWII